MLEKGLEAGRQDKCNRFDREGATDRSKSAVVVLLRKKGLPD